MQCTQCGFIMSAFDAECPRCVKMKENVSVGAGNAPAMPPELPVELTPSPLPPQAQPAAPFPAQPAGDVVFIAPAAQPRISLANPQHNVIVFCMAAAIFAMGYFLPWASISILGITVGISGSAFDINLCVLVLIAAATAMSIYEYLTGNPQTFNVARALLCGGALCFCVDKITTLLAISFSGVPLSPGFGLILMLLAAGFLFYLTAADLPETSRWVVVGLEAALIALIIAYSAVTASSQKSDYTNFFSGAPSTAGILPQDDATATPSDDTPPPQAAKAADDQTPRGDDNPPQQPEEAAPAPDVATMDEYNQIQTGMSYDQVQGIMGTPGEEVSHSDVPSPGGMVQGVSMEMYMWKNDNGSSMSTTFQNGQLIQKGQFGLR